MLKEVFEYANLLSVYQNLLPQSQKEVLKLFYFDNIGLSEQAEIKQISRQAVKDCLVKGQKALKNFESKLNLCCILKNAKEVLSESDFKKIFEKEVF